MLHDGAVDGAPEIGMLICNDAGLVAYAVVDILKEGVGADRTGERGQATDLEATLTEKLVPRSKGNLYDGAQLGQLLCGVVLDVGDALRDMHGAFRTSVCKGARSGGAYLKVGNELLDDCLPRDETLDEDIGGSEIMRGDVLLDE